MTSSTSVPAASKSATALVCASARAEPRVPSRSNFDQLRPGLPRRVGARSPPRQPRAPPKCPARAARRRGRTRSEPSQACRATPRCRSLAGVSSARAAAAGRRCARSGRPVRGRLHWRFPTGCGLPHDAVGDRASVLLEVGDRRHGLERREPAGELLDLLLDDLLCPARPRPARTDGCARRPPGGRRCRTALTPSSSAHAASMSRGTAMSISSSGRPLALSHHLGELVAPSTIGWGEAVARDDDVRSQQLLGQHVERTPSRRSAGRGRAPGRAWRLATKTVPAAGGEPAPCAASSAGLARAEDHHVAPGKIAEQLAGQVDRDRRTRSADARRSPSRSARACRSCSAAAEEAVEQRRRWCRRRAPPRRRA